MLRTCATIATTILLIACSTIPLAPEDARKLYICVKLSAKEKARLKETRALDRGTLEKINRNNFNFGCPS